MLALYAKIHHALLDGQAGHAHVHAGPGQVVPGVGLAESGVIPDASVELDHVHRVVRAATVLGQRLGLPVTELGAG